MIHLIPGKLRLPLTLPCGIKITVSTCLTMFIPTYQEIKNHPIVIGEVKIYLVWFDSYGAKSSCVFIETPDLNLLVDPGASAL